mgnify:CR=1 FL=1
MRLLRKKNGGTAGGERLARGGGLCYTVRKGGDAMIVNVQLWGRVLACYLLAVNVLAFALMGIDKHKARRGAWRIPEKTLFLPVLLGGGAGGCLGMRVFRHKTRHWYFRFGFPLITLLWLGLIIWLMNR